MVLKGPPPEDAENTEDMKEVLPSADGARSTSAVIVASCSNRGWRKAIWSECKMVLNARTWKTELESQFCQTSANLRRGRWWACAGCEQIQIS